MGRDRLIFLDVDGVLNSEIFFTTASEEARKTMIDENAVKLLNQLEGSSVVISSSWGEDAIKPLLEHGLKLPIIGCTTHLHHKFEWACRGNEIEEWLLEKYKGLGTKYGNEYDCDKYSYVIFDDDSDMLLGQEGHFIRTNRTCGLTQEDIDKAQKILR